jgi:predicted Zn-dependent protease with MMP-like domain
MPRLSSRAFDRAVREAMSRIPEEFARHIRDVAVLVEEEPPAEVLAELGVPEDETLFGAYFGTPYGEKSVFDVPVEPDRIVIYKGPLEDSCETVEELIEEIEITVVHEAAHHFGIDEEVLDRYGYG